MSLYFDNELESPSNSTATLLSWHKQQNILAVAYKWNNGGTFYIYNRIGRKITCKPELEKKAEVTSFSWHTERQLLAVGWSSGELFVWNNQDQTIHEITTIHNNPIKVLVWCGSKLGSGDKDGNFATWKIDSFGKCQPNPMFRNNFQSIITDCVSKVHGHLSHISITNLAKAAVDGDQAALDILAGFKSEFNSRMKVPHKEGESFFIGTDDGKVYSVNEKGDIEKHLSLDHSIKQILHSKNGKYLIVVSSDLQVVKCKFDENEKPEEVERVKFSGEGSSSQICWIGRSLLAVATSDHSLRLWDVKSGDNFSLPLSDDCGFSSSERITTVDYLVCRGYIAATTDRSNLAVWVYQRGNKKEKREPEDYWRLLPVISLKVCPAKIQWNPTMATAAITSQSTAWLITEQKVNSCISNMLVATQTGKQQLVVDFIGIKNHDELDVSGLNLSPEKNISQINENTNHLEINTQIAFNGMDISSEHLAVWNNNTVEVYEITSSSKYQHIGSFTCNSFCSALHDQSFFSIDKEKGEQMKILVRNFQGTVKQLLTMQEKEGKPVMLSTTGNFLVVGTDIGCIRVYDLSRRDAKPFSTSKHLSESIDDFGDIFYLSCSPNGTKIAILCTKDNGVPDSRLYVYDTEVNKLHSFDFASGLNDEDEMSDFSGSKSDMEQSKLDAAWEISGRYPISVHWDVTESRLLSCEAQISDDHEETDKKRDKNAKRDKEAVQKKPKLTAEAIVVSLFSTQDHGLMLQDAFEKKEEEENLLIGLKVPFFYFTPKTAGFKEKEKWSVSRRTMKDFVGLDSDDKSTLKSMLNFSFHLTAGDMDEAFKSIKLIKGSRVWESMAKMCVKSKRLDVAQVCLARMGHARGVRAIREAEKEPEKNARVARLAVELKMNDEAEKLYIESSRFDLLNNFYQATGQWEKALEAAEVYDRIHLRTTYYNYAKHLETIGELPEAISHYEKSGTHHFEVPRMLFDEPETLEEYIMKSKDRKFRKWWAQYMESTGDMDSALKFYKQASDPLSLVRVYSFLGQLDKAAEIANEYEDRAACFHLARQYEQNEDIKQAIHFFTRALAYGNAIRICKEHGFEDQLMNLALLSSPADMIEAARYYENQTETIDKAIMLYQKAGNFSKAIELAFEHEQFSALESISSSLNDKTDPVLLARCADFFTEHGQHDRAVGLLVSAKKFTEAIEICSENNVQLDEDLVEKLTVPKDRAFHSKERDELLIKLADCCMKQGSYHLACKKYTQAGVRDKAMKALLKSGDTERIVFFAGASKQRNIYVMAANYLQSLDWRKEAEVMKNIITFYTKGKAYDSLANFYDACAQVEIDEYQNYEKAVGALTEAFKCLTKAKTSDQSKKEDKITELKSKIALIKKFITTRRLFENDREDGIKQCLSLLAEPDLNSSVRYGDIYSLLIEHYASQQNYQKAYQLVQELKQKIPNIMMSFFVNMRTLENVYHAVGAPLHSDNFNERIQNEDSEEEEVGEELYEENRSPMTRSSFAFR